MATWSTDIVTSLTNLGGVASLEEIYNETRNVRLDPHPQSLTAIIRGTIEDNSSDSAKFKGSDLFFSAKGIGSGIWGLRSFVKQTPKATDIEEPLGNNTPDRVMQETYRILRDTQLSRQIKLLHKNCCQICGVSIPLANGNCYSEAHHIKPLGGLHSGPDVASNILILCPNHHVMLDYGVQKLDLKDIKIHPNHKINFEYIRYHNEVIFEKAANKPLEPIR